MRFYITEMSSDRLIFFRDLSWKNSLWLFFEIQLKNPTDSISHRKYHHRGSDVFSLLSLPFRCQSLPENSGEKKKDSCVFFFYPRREKQEISSNKSKISSFIHSHINCTSRCKQFQLHAIFMQFRNRPR